MHIFYSTDINDNIITLPADESAHCIRVLRLGRGDHVQIIDGRGNIYEAVILVPDAKSCRLEITATRKVGPQRNFNLHIAIAPTKSIDRFEWFIEKSVEIGIDTITPLLCRRSERRVLKTDRLQKLIISTIKQAMVPHLTVLEELTPFSEFITHYAETSGNRYIAHCEASERKIFREALVRGQDTLILIGPEGDFSPNEIASATGNGFIPVSLGRNRLRTETAGIVSCCVINNC